MSNRQFISMTAGEDLSSSQYKIMYVDAANSVKQRNTKGVGVFGVLNNKPQSAEHASVVVGGLTRCMAGGTVAAGSWITVSASGTGITVSSGEYILGKAVTGVASGSYFQLLVQHNGYRG